MPSPTCAGGASWLATFIRAPAHLRWGPYGRTIADPRTWEAVRLTLFTAAIAVPLNTIFGVAAAWAVSKFEFRGKAFLISLIDLPFSVSPVVAGLVFVLIFGARGWLGPTLEHADFHYPWLFWRGFGHAALPWWPGEWGWIHQRGVRIIFSWPGIVLATVFVTFPFVARELIPLMQAQGNEEELAARVLGASAVKTFFRVTLPNIKWGLLYGVILCNARAMGEFGAVYVVSSNTDDQLTVPLRVQRLYDGDLSATPAFAVASLLALLAVVTLVLKSIVEWKFKKELRGASAEATSNE